MQLEREELLATLLQNNEGDGASEDEDQDKQDDGQDKQDDDQDKRQIANVSTDATQHRALYSGDHAGDANTYV